MRTSGETAELFAALAAAQAAFGPVKKDRVNPHYRSRYATLDSVLSAVRTALAANGLAVLQAVEIGEGSGTLTVQTRLVHKTGQWVETSATCAILGSKGTPNVQDVGKHVTYLRRYTLGALLSVAPDEDDDGEATSNTPAPQPDPDVEKFEEAVGALRSLYRGAKDGRDSHEVLRSLGRLLPDLDRLASIPRFGTVITSGLAGLAKVLEAGTESDLRQAALSAVKVNP